MGATLVEEGTEEVGVKVEEDNPPKIRENLIETAVKFLENSKIRSTSTELKTTFLKKKGLTDEEIATAFKEVKTIEEIQTQAMTGGPTSGESGLPGLPPPSYMAPFIPAAIPKEYPISKKVRDILNLMLLIGGFGYGINYLWKKYLRPWWYGIEKQSSDQILLQTSQTLLTTVLTLKEGMDKLQESLEKMSGHETRAENEVTDLKKEVMSLKGLLLSSRSFPQNPAILTSPSPSIPSWQLESTTTTPVKIKSIKSSLEEEGVVADASAPWDASSGVSNRTSGTSDRSSGSEIEMIGHESSGGEEAAGEDQTPIENLSADDNLD